MHCARRAILLLLLLTLCRPAGAQEADRRDWGVSEFLFPTDQPGVYDLCLDRRPVGVLTVTPRLPEVHAEALELGALRSFPARISLLPAPVPTPGWKQLSTLPGRSWIGLRWDTAGLPPGLYRLQVSVPCDTADAAGQPVILPTPKAAALSVYLPRPDGLQVARVKYLGRRVWLTSPLSLFGAAGTGYQFAPQTSFRIKSITRPPHPCADLALNGGDGPGWDLSPADLVTHNPLRVVFDQPRRVKVTARGWTGPKQPRFRPPLFQDFADPWQMDRALRLSPPERFTPLTPGMTPQQVIDTLGWPTEYGTLAQLAARPVWRYDSLKPFYASVYFAHGKFVRCDPGGHLP